MRSPIGVYSQLQSIEQESKGPKDRGWRSVQLKRIPSVSPQVALLTRLLPKIESLEFCEALTGFRKIIL